VTGDEGAGRAIDGRTVTRRDIVGFRLSSTRCSFPSCRTLRRRSLTAHYDAPGGESARCDAAPWLFAAQRIQCACERLQKVFSGFRAGLRHNRAWLGAVFERKLCLSFGGGASLLRGGLRQANGNGCLVDRLRVCLADMLDFLPYESPACVLALCLAFILARARDGFLLQA